MAERSVVEALAVVRSPVSVGDAEKTTLPDPVSSESHVANCTELEKRVEVAVSTHALPLYERNSPFAAAVIVTSESSVSACDSASSVQVVPLQVNSPKSEAPSPVAKRSREEVAKLVHVLPFHVRRSP